MALNTYRVPVSVGPGLGHAKVYVAAPDPATAKAMAVMVTAKAFPMVYGVGPGQVRAVSATLYSPSIQRVAMIVSIEFYAEGEIPF